LERTHASSQKEIFPTDTEGEKEACQGFGFEVSRFEEAFEGPRQERAAGA
jgi:hypothetical protein